MEARNLLVLLLALSYSSTAHQSETSNSVLTGTPKLVHDLFENVTISAHTKANIITSLQYSPKEETCGEFMFNLMALNATTEYIFTADLYLWLHIPSPPQHPVYYVNIKPVHADHRNAQPIKRELELGSSESDRYVKFDVSRLLREFVSDGESSILLNVSISSSIENFDDSILSCNQESEVRFAYTGFTDTTVPTLIVYSYAEKLAHINYAKISQLIRQNSTANDNARRKRSGFSPCRVEPLMVSPSLSFFEGTIKDAVGDEKEFSFVTGDFDAGTCKGDCDFGIPNKSPSKHAKVVDILIKNNSLRKEDYEQCCVPVTFKNLKITIQFKSLSYALVLLKAVAVKDCECLSFKKISAL